MKRYTSEDLGAVSEELLGELKTVMVTSLTDPEKRDCLSLRALEAFKDARLTPDDPVGQLVEHLAINVGWWVMEQQAGEGGAGARVADLERQNREANALLVKLARRAARGRCEVHDEPLVLVWRCEDPANMNGAPRTVCPECLEEKVEGAESKNAGFEALVRLRVEERDEARTKVAELEGLYAAAVERLQDLGETEVPLGPGAAEEMKAGMFDLQRGDVVEVVKRLSTYHRVGARVAVTHVSERGDFRLATGDAGTPSMVYGFAYRPHVKVVRRKEG